MKRLPSGILLGLVLLIWAGCHKPAADVPASSSSQGRTNAKQFYMVVPLKGHPALQIAQMGFKQACLDLGFPFQILGTDTWDVPGTISLAEQAMAKGDAAAMVIWSGNPAFHPFCQRAGQAGIPIILPHFPLAENSAPGVTGIIGCDPAEYGRESAWAIGKAINGTGTVAVTQGGFNTTENLAAASFQKAMAERFPKVKVLDPIEEGFDPPQAIAKAVAALQADPAVVAAFSTTGAGSVTWAMAQRETGRKVINIGMDYTRINLDLVRSGECYAVVGQPLWDEAYGAVGLLVRTLRGEKIPWWTKLPAPIITKDKLEPFYQLLTTRVEPAVHAEAHRGSTSLVTRPDLSPTNR